MANISLIPRNGVVTYGSYAADFAAFSITGSQSVENVTPYDISKNCSKNCGNQTPDFDISISAFALAHGTGSPPQLPGSSTAANTAFSGAGFSTTLTLDTGVSEALVMVVSRVQISHGRMRAAVPYDIQGKNAAEVTETWPTS